MRDLTKPSGMLINVAKHVGNITFEVSKKLQANIRYSEYWADKVHLLNLLTQMQQRVKKTQGLEMRFKSWKPFTQNVFLLWKLQTECVRM